MPVIRFITGAWSVFGVGILLDPPRASTKGVTIVMACVGLFGGFILSVILGGMFSLSAKMRRRRLAGPHDVERNRLATWLAGCATMLLPVLCGEFIGKVMKAPELAVDWTGGLLWVALSAVAPMIVFRQRPAATS